MNQNSEGKTPLKYQWIDMEDGEGKYYRLKDGGNIIDLLNISQKAESALQRDNEKLRDALKEASKFIRQFDSTDMPGQDPSKLVAKIQAALSETPKLEGK